MTLNEWIAWDLEGRLVAGAILGVALVLVLLFGGKRRGR
jgi:hypothetical protein